jgi:hypothetical protein
MTDSEPTNPEDIIDVRRLANAVRLFAFAIVMGLSLFNFTIVRSISRFETMFGDMLGGKPLPLVTQLVIEGKLVLLLVAGLFPAFALWALLSPRVVPAIYALGIAALIALLEAGVVFLVLFLPLVEIMKQMGGGM